MSIAVDTNVIIDIVAGDVRTVARAMSVMQETGGREALFLCPVVYAELHAHPGWKAVDIDSFLQNTNVLVDWELSQDVWSRAGSSFSTYCRRRTRSGGGSPRRLLADFVIGAHAESVGGIVTADVSFFKTNFPALRIVDAGG